MGVAMNTQQGVRSRAVRTGVFAVSVGMLLLSSGCQYAYLQMFRTRTLLPPTETQPQLSNAAGLVLSGAASATNGKTVSLADNQNYLVEPELPFDTVPEEFGQDYENIFWTPPELTGSVSLRFNTGKLFSVSAAGAVSRIRDDYSFGGSLGVGLGYAGAGVGGRLDIEVGRYRCRNEATILLRGDPYWYGSDDTVRVSTRDDNDSRVAATLTINSVKPLLGMQFGGRLRLDEIFSYNYRAEDNRVAVRFTTLAPGVFVTKQLRSWAITAGYTFVAVFGTDGPQSSAGVHTGWAQVQYALTLPGRAPAFPQGGEAGTR